MNIAELDLNELSVQFGSLCEENPQGLLNSKMEEYFHFITIEQRAALVNHLLVSGSIKLFEDERNEIIYKWAKEDEQRKFKGMGVDERLIYQLIEREGNHGIWVRDLKKRSNLLNTIRLNKILKNMVSRCLIKSVKSVAAKNTIVYMLYDIEPSPEITGGVWYQEHEHDSAFVNTLYELCKMYICQAHNPVTISQVLQHVHLTEISRVELNETHIQQVLDTLLVDGAIETITPEKSYNDNNTNINITSNINIDYDNDFFDNTDSYEKPIKRTKYSLNELLYRKSPFSSITDDFTEIPCAICPISSECYDNRSSPINPTSCMYLNKWLSNDIS